jgi:hypothetical protein
MRRDNLKKERKEEHQESEKNVSQCRIWGESNYSDAIG